MGQQNGGYQHGADDGLRAVQGKIAGGANEGQQCGNNALDRELKQLIAPMAAAPIPNAINLVRIGTRRSRRSA